MNWQWVIDNAGRIIDLAGDHLAITAPAVLFATLIAVPLGWLAHRSGPAREVLVATTSLIYVVPSLAMFILMPLVLGTSILSPVNVVAAMTLYGTALLVRSSADAFDAVPGDVIQSADAAGYPPLKRVFAVELPLAAPALLSGLRVVSASTVSLVSVGALIGVQSLGTLFTEGFQRSFPTEILTGLIATVVLAVALDLVIVVVKHTTLPWARLKG